MDLKTCIVDMNGALQARLMGNSRHRFLSKRWVLALCFGIASVFASYASAEPSQGDLAEAWEAVRWFEFNDANTLFNELAERENGKSPEILFGRAVTLINRQPKTSANIAKAESFLERIKARDPHNEWGVRARFFLARIAQIHREHHDLDRAKGIYSELLREHGETLVGQLAAINWAILHLYTPDTSTSIESRLADVEALVFRVRGDWAKKDLHLLLGSVYLQSELSEERSLDHYVAAGEIGILSTGYRAGIYITIGSLAERLGETEIALKHYRSFVQEYPRDNRTYTIRKRIEALLEGSK